MSGGNSYFDKFEIMKPAKRKELFLEMQSLKNSENEKDKARALEIRNEIVAGNVYLINWIIEKGFLKDFDIPEEEKIEMATISLLKAVEDYSFEHKTNFKAFFSKVTYRTTIREYQHDIRKNKIFQNIEETREKLYKELEREPSTEEIAVELGIKVEKVKEIERFFAIRDYSKLTKENVEADTNKDDLEMDSNKGKNIETEEIKAIIDKALDKLEEKDREIVRLRIGFDDGIPKTLEEVGKKCGLSGEGVRQKIAKALKILSSNEKIADWVK